MAEVAQDEKGSRPRRQAESDGRALVQEMRRLLKKAGSQIPQVVAKELEQAAVAVESAVTSGSLEDLQSGSVALEKKMEEHLAFARKSAAREYFESIGVAVLIALVLRAFVIEAFQIPSGSMIPTLEIGDHIFVSKFSYGLSIPFTNKKIFQWAEPKRGDVIVFKYPKDPEIDYIKRVIGLPGDKVEGRRGEIWVNGRPMTREILAEPCRMSDRTEQDGVVAEITINRDCELWSENLDGKVHRAAHNTFGSGRDFSETVEPGRFFVMGDNRDNSNDSRFWGTVPADFIKGRALVVWWSKPTTEGGLKEWFRAIAWRRFFTLVQ